MKVSHDPQAGSWVPGQRGVSIKGVLRVIADKEHTRIRRRQRKQVVSPRIAEVTVQGQVMRHRHADLQRVGLGLMVRQHAVNVIAGRRNGDVLDAVAGGSVEVPRILQAVVKAAILVLIDEIQKVSYFDLSASGYVSCRVVVGTVLGGGVAVGAACVVDWYYPVAAHIEVLHLAVPVPGRPTAFDKQLHRYLGQLHLDSSIVHPASDTQQGIGRDGINADDVRRNHAGAEIVVVVEVADEAAVVEGEIKPLPESEARLQVIVIPAKNVPCGLDGHVLWNIHIRQGQ